MASPKIVHARVALAAAGAALMVGLVPATSRAAEASKETDTKPSCVLPCVAARSQDDRPNPWNQNPARAFYGVSRRAPAIPVRE